ncbi:MAG: metallophosphoesterase [Kiritimatiellae bacterium]|nr:metallophosphoesterase [Kiritimatiellia bacterium]
MSITINRRGFVCGIAAAAASAAAAADKNKSAAGTKSRSGEPSAKKVKPGKLIASAPVLQNAAETSMGVAFAVTADASGWVDVSQSPDMSGAVRVFSGGTGLMDVNDKIALIRIRGLKPATRYWYRIGADRIDYQGGYGMTNLGPEVDEKVHSFKTLGASVQGGSFCVINDTHDRKPVLDQVLTKIEELKPSVVIWNGDASNTSETIETAMGIFIHTHERHPEYAADTPYMFINGNHDFRGRFNRRLCDLMMFREPTERAPEYEELGRNFVQRLGDIALIGLDTGEDKLDSNKKFAGIFCMAEYRKLQTRWLAEAIETPAVKEAKFKVAFCHIPLFDPRPDQNPGDIAPDDESPLYKNNWASWQRTCANLWGPLLAKAGVQLVVCAHQHCFRYNAPEPGRPWAHLVGGGCNGVNANRNLFPTVIEGKVIDGKLSITVHDVLYKRVVFQQSFA